MLLILLIYQNQILHKRKRRTQERDTLNLHHGNNHRSCLTITMVCQGQHSDNLVGICGATIARVEAAAILFTVNWVVGVTNSTDYWWLSSITSTQKLIPRASQGHREDLSCEALGSGQSRWEVVSVIFGRSCEYSENILPDLRMSSPDAI